MEIETSEQLAFIPEQVENIVMDVIDGILKTELYMEEKVNRDTVPRATRSFPGSGGHVLPPVAAPCLTWDDLRSHNVCEQQRTRSDLICIAGGRTIPEGHHLSYVKHVLAGRRSDLLYCRLARNTTMVLYIKLYRPLHFDSTQVYRLWCTVRNATTLRR